MRNLRKFLIFLLFTAFLGTLAYSLFPAELRDLAQNVRDGSGERAFIMAVQGADGAAYAVRAMPGGGYRLYGVGAGGGQSARALSEGLPADFEIESLHVAGDGTVLLGAYGREGASLTGYGLYAAGPKQPFQLLLEAPLSGVTADEKRQSAGLAALEQADETVLLTVRQAGAYRQYAFDPGKGQGLTARGGDGPQAGPSDAQERAWALAREAGLDLGRVTFLAITPEGGALAILEERALYALSAGGEAADLSAGLYRTAWQSALILLGVVLAVLVPAYGFYYLVCEVKKLYFPLVVKNLLWLSLLGYAAVSAGMLLFVAPGYRAGARANVQAALQATAAQAQAQDDAGLLAAAQALAQTNAAYGDCAFTLYRPGPAGAWEAAASSGGGAAAAPDMVPGELARLALAGETGQSAFTARLYGAPHYFLYAPKAEGGILCLRVNARAIEGEISGQLRAVALGGYGVALLLALSALWALGGAAKGARRVTRGIDLLGAGEPQVRVVHSSGDELEALAAAFNDLSGAVEARRAGASLAGNAYLRFVPRRLLALLGASDIEKVDKNTSASHEMAMMVVRFTFPKALYQSEAQTLFDNINEVFAHIAGMVSGAGGAIYNFTYDGFDAAFESGPLAAVGAAVAVRQALMDLNAERETRGDVAVELRVALDYGVAMMGVVGDEDRVVPTVVSACLSTARNLVELAGVLDANILCTTPVADAAGAYGLRYIGKCRNVGASIRVYEIYDGDPYSVRLAKEGTRGQFSGGVYALYSGQFSEAKRLFMEIARRQGGDGVARHYLYLADQFEKKPPERIGLN